MRGQEVGGTGWDGARWYGRRRRQDNIHIHIYIHTHICIPGRGRLDPVDADHGVAALVLHPVHRHDVQPHLPVAVEELRGFWGYDGSGSVGDGAARSGAQSHDRCCFRPFIRTLTKLDWWLLVPGAWLGSSAWETKLHSTLLCRSGGDWVWYMDIHICIYLEPKPTDATTAPAHPGRAIVVRDHGREKEGGRGPMPDDVVVQLHRACVIYAMCVDGGCVSVCLLAASERGCD